jgi:hypothetical protein
MLASEDWKVCVEKEERPAVMKESCRGIKERENFLLKL